MDSNQEPKSTDLSSLDIENAAKGPHNTAAKDLHNIGSTSEENFLMENETNTEKSVSQANNLRRDSISESEKSEEAQESTVLVNDHQDEDKQNKEIGDPEPRRLTKLQLLQVGWDSFHTKETCHFWFLV